MSSITDASARSLHRLESPSAASTMLFGYQVCSSSGSLLHSPRAVCCSIGGHLGPARHGSVGGIVLWETRTSSGKARLFDNPTLLWYDSLPASL